MNRLYSELQWLPKAPQDFPAKLRALHNACEALGSEVRSLAKHALDLNQLTKLSRVISSAQSDGKTLPPLTPFRLAVLNNSTIDQ